MEIEFEAEIGKYYVVNTKQIELIIHNVQKVPKHIKIDDKNSKVNWDSKSKTLTIPIVWNTTNEVEIKIQLNNN